MAERTTIFSWGYWGWGNAVPELVEAVDAVERRRGFKPPIFVDIRYSRSVRAIGFREGSFEALVGPARYLWMRGLGNRSIATGSEKPEIADPEAATELLELALKAARERRRAIFFCACEIPGACHRRLVTELLLGVAKRRRDSVEVVEWPGGEPIRLSLTVPSQHFRAVSRTAKLLPLGAKVDLGKLGGIPHRSLLQLEAEGNRLSCLCGPAVFTAKQWKLLIHDRRSGSEAGPELERLARQQRKQLGYAPLRNF
jgi:hypothetical protein